MTCTNCGSSAINEHLHGRTKGMYRDLCDVCYWRQRYTNLLDEMEMLIERYVERGEA